MCLLEPLGFAVCEAVNGEEAVNIWRKWQPHLIFMDMHMLLMPMPSPRQLETCARTTRPYPMRWNYSLRIMTTPECYCCLPAGRPTSAKQSLRTQTCRRTDRFMLPQQLYKWN
ncbi:MAG: response regulator [Noviherbaspirillum sp.]